MESTVLVSKIVSVLRVTASYTTNQFRVQQIKPKDIDLDRSHDLLHILRIELQHTIEDANLIVPEWLFARAVKLQKRLELSFLVCVCAVDA